MSTLFDLKASDEVSSSLLRIALISYRDQCLRLRKNFPEVYESDTVKEIDEVLYFIDTSLRIRLEKIA